MIHKFFTIWIFVLVIFHNISSKFLSLPFLTFIVLFNGLYFSYVNPTKYYIDYYDSTIIIDGYKKIIVDIVFHISPFIFIYLIYGLETFFINWKVIPSLLLIYLYNYINNPTDIYRIPINEITIVSVFTVFLYIFIINLYL